MVFDIFKWGSIVLGIGLILTIYIFFNILGNGYYYATHGKYQNDNKNYPFVYWLANHELPKEYVPSYEVTIDSRLFANVSSVSSKNIYGKEDAFELSWGGPSYYPEAKYDRYGNFDINSDHYYISMSTGKIDGEGELDKVIDKQEARRRAYTLLNDVRSEIRENSKSPKINLQWIFNWYFQWISRNEI